MRLPTTITTTFLLLTSTSAQNLISPAPQNTTITPLNFTCSTLLPTTLTNTIRPSLTNHRVSKASICPSFFAGRCTITPSGTINISTTVNDTRISDPTFVNDLLARYLRDRGIVDSIETFEGPVTRVGFNSSGSVLYVEPGRSGYASFTPEMICFEGTVEMNDTCEESEDEGVRAVRENFAGRGLDVCVPKLTRYKSGKRGSVVRVDGEVRLVEVGEGEARGEGMDKVCCCVGGNEGWS